MLLTFIRRLNFIFNTINNNYYYRVLSMNNYIIILFVLISLHYIFKNIVKIKSNLGYGLA